ncbi:uncharacterized protein LOC126665280 [Mercurialis annua]|uniref:uncharacterized protein LOC126665280 n=1 Tax=Mercurialis annua TaxID=3986 RepID=UPI00215DF73D|nr:uncharacterized protein LOC126665280 [Mercurialis annua]
MLSGLDYFWLLLSVFRSSFESDAALVVNKLLRGDEGGAIDNVQLIIEDCLPIAMVEMLASSTFIERALKWLALLLSGASFLAKIVFLMVTFCIRFVNLLIVVRNQ